LILSRNNDLTSGEVKSIICENVDPYDPEYYIGTGRVNAYKALMAANINPANPTCSYDETNDALVVMSIDPNNDMIRYGVSWDNNQNVDFWTYYHNSSWEISIDCDDHKGTVGVIAEDEYGAQSEWVSVTPKSKPFIYGFLQRFLNNHPNMFPLLHQILNL